MRLFPLLFENGCSQSSRFPTAGQGKRSSGNEIASGQVQLRKSAIHGLPVTLRIPRVKSDKSDWFWSQYIVFTQSFKTGISLGLARGPDISSAWQKGPLGTRLASTAVQDNSSFQKKLDDLQKYNKCSRDSSSQLQKAHNGVSIILNRWRFL